MDAMVPRGQCALEPGPARKTIIGSARQIEHPPSNCLIFIQCVQIYTKHPSRTLDENSLLPFEKGAHHMGAPIARSSCP